MTKNVVWQTIDVSRRDREQLNGHRAAVIWFTGLLGSGKSTLANGLNSLLFQRGCRSYVLDGDNIRHGLNSDLGFSDDSRVENIRRVSEVAKLLYDAGLIVITAFISPFEKERAFARKLIGDHFMEIFVDVPLEICKKRDPKGLYKKAMDGKISEMTGVNSPYESPQHAELVLKAAEMNIAESLSFIVESLEAQGIFSP